MLSDWLFQHGGALQLLPWSLGMVLGLRQIARRTARPWLAVGVLSALTVLGILALDPHAVPAFLGPLVDLRGVEVDAQWAGAAALILAGVQHHGGDRRSWSLLPVVSIGWLGGGALVSAVAIAATGALERGRPRRLALFAALALLGLSHAVDDWSLWLWVKSMQWLWLGQDQASLLVDLSEQVLRAGGWGALVRWSLHLRR